MAIEGLSIVDRSNLKLPDLLKSSSPSNTEVRQNIVEADP